MYCSKSKFAATNPAALSKTFFNRISFSGKCYSEYCDRTNGLCPGKICEAGKAILSPSKFNTAHFWSLGWSGDQCNEPVCVWSLCGLDGVCVLPGQCVCTKLYSQVHIAHFVKLYLENVTFLSLGLRNGEWYKNKDRMLLVTSQWTDRRCHHNSSLNIVITSMYSGGTAWHRWGLVNLSHRTWRSNLTIEGPMASKVGRNVLPILSQPSHNKVHSIFIDYTKTRPFSNFNKHTNILYTQGFLIG